MDRFDLPKNLGDLRKIERIPTEDRGLEINHLVICLCENAKPSCVYRQYGCEEPRSRASGLCFKRYTTTLLEAVSPQRLGKDVFISSGRELVKESMKSGLKGILAGIKHLHSLGLVHNAINPANIILDEDGTLIFIDFDSCRYIGESLRKIISIRRSCLSDGGDIQAFRRRRITRSTRFAHKTRSS